MPSTHDTATHCPTCMELPWEPDPECGDDCHDDHETAGYR